MSRRFALLGILTATVAAYLPSMTGELQFDDARSITDNLAIKSLDRFFQFGFFSRLAGGRPLTELTFALDYAAGGLDVRWFHATNVALHLGAVLLVYLLSLVTLERAGAGRRPWAALAVAGIFSLHPLQSQAVSYVVQRAEVLASLCYVGALLLLLRADDEVRPARAAALYAAGAALFLLGLGAKPIVATLPAAFLLHRLALARPDAGRKPWWRTAALAAPLLAASAALAARTIGGLGPDRSDAGFHLASVTPREYLLTQLRVLVRYLQLSLWPAGQNLDYQLQKSTRLGATELASGALLLALAGAGLAAWAWARRRPANPDAPAARLFALGAGWFFLVLAPSSSLVPLADLIEEHRMYLALWGLLLATLALALAAGRRLPERARGPAGALAAALALSALGVALHARNEVWSSRVALWSDVVAKSPDKARAHMNLGHSLYQAGELEGAVAEYRQAMLLDTDATVAWDDILRNLAAALVGLGRGAEAIPFLEMGLANHPNNDELLANLAICQLETQDVAGAERSARRALEVNPHQGSAHNTMGEVLYRKREYVEALREFRVGLALDPDNAARRYNVALTLEHLGNALEACDAWRFCLGNPRPAQERTLITERMARLGCAP
ncbi:MAG TPA: tetratricopeptide repeat protein [Anaeromyxobacteraceae bacterium]|jgi:Flp pilus assembly protein TadD|nr:tetratricopeptide repeat protein [Anaeromyxobacteraceae bacterium]